MTAAIDFDQPPDERPTISHHTAYGDALTQITLNPVLDEQGEETAGQWYVPFRPIVFGGDDVTFVCDGQLGLSLVLTYLKAFETQTVGLFEKPKADATDRRKSATACAGIAIVKTHYPFARAYALAEELCASAKRICRDREVSGLDWHFALSGLAGDIGDIRLREYTAREGSLTLRPVTIGRETGLEQQSWLVIEQGIAAFQDQRLTEQNRPDWSARRNKVKALRDALRSGGDAVQHFRLRFLERDGQPEKLPEVGLAEAFRERGWDAVDLKPDRPGNPDKACGYFDAIELADWFIPLPLHALKKRRPK